MRKVWDPAEPEEEYSSAMIQARTASRIRETAFAGIKDTFLLSAYNTASSE